MSAVPWWSRIVLALQLLLAMLFGVFTWLLSVSLGQGREPVLGDALVLTVPVLLVLVFGALAVWCWRQGKRTAAALLTIAPFPAALPLLAVLMV